METSPIMTDVFDFMELRAPFSPEEKSLRQNYIHDDIIDLVGEEPARIDSDLQSNNSPSIIGRIVYEDVFCNPRGGSAPTLNNYSLTDKILGILPLYGPLCPKQAPIEAGENGVHSLSINEIERCAHINFRDQYYLLPERLEQVEGLKLYPEMLYALKEMEKAKIDFDLNKLVRELESIFGEIPLDRVVFNNGIYSDDFRATKRVLFDTLYLLYILRRRTSVNLEYVIQGLKVLHVLEALAVDEILKKSMPSSNSISIANRVSRMLARRNQVDITERTRGGLLSKNEICTLKVFFSSLHTWNGSDTPIVSPLIGTKADYDAYFRATPVIHPIFAKLHWYKKPFNNLRPIGIGDLKVVKQWLVAYLPGEISYIENIMRGEKKDRVHRRLERTEEMFATSVELSEETQKDSQTTDRFELKKEAENIIKTNQNVSTNANVTATYSNTGYSVVANVGANFAYTRDTSETNKTSGLLFRETMTKAVSRVQQKRLEKREVTKLFETEETNTHGFTGDVQGTGHISGIYRWVDKKYKAQLYNYGKRMMFEFIVPEPAAFFVESRLRNFTASVDCPQPPQKPVYEDVILPVSKPDDITKDKFQELKLKYDLSDFSWPEETRKVVFIDQATQNDFFHEDPDRHDQWWAKTYSCRARVTDYEISDLFVTGNMSFHEGGPAYTGVVLNANYDTIVNLNTLVVNIGGDDYRFIDNREDNWGWNYSPSLKDKGSCLNWHAKPSKPCTFNSDDIQLTLGFWEIISYRLSVSATLKYSDAKMLEFQENVFKRVAGLEKAKVDAINEEKDLAYNTEMVTYRNRIDELKAQAINELLQGQSEAFNREIINKELKKHCITMLAKEFDANYLDDQLSCMDTIGVVDDYFYFRKFEVNEDLENGKTSFTLTDPGTPREKIPYPSIKIPEAQEKGRYIQFLEQAFEWQQLTYIFYPYFWATRPKWIDMMNRKDDTDPCMTDFLQAGSSRVLLAVTPAYDHAVMHFLATREPWEGGPSPVIGDPLFIPLYEEVRKQQDDLYNAVPEGEPWTFVLPTSLVYLQDSSSNLPEFPDKPSG